MEGKKSFVLYTNYIETFEALSDEDAGKLIKVIFQYVNDLNPQPEGLIKLTFIPIKQNLKRDLKEWEELKQKRSEAGKIGMKNRWHKNNNDITSDNKDNTDNFDITNITDNDNVNVNDNDNVNVINNKEKDKSINKDNSIGKRFLKPNIDEIKEYCYQRNNDIDPEEFYDYYESIGWKVGKNPMKDWKACMRTWERKYNKENNFVVDEKSKEIVTEEINDAEKIDLLRFMEDL